MGRRWLAGLAAALLLQGGAAAPSDEGDEQALQADPAYAAGSAALKAQAYERALPQLLQALKRFPDSANLRNELGYAYRKLGQLEPAFEHYRRALAIDPRHRGAHEYIGEAYLMVDDVASAEKHLEALRGICVLGCEEARDLQVAIEEWRRKRAAKEPVGRSG